MTISYESRHREPRPMTAAEALVEATYWLHFGSSPVKALPWLTIASNRASEQADFDEIRRLAGEARRMIDPEKWRAYQRGALKIRSEYHPRSLIHRNPQKASGARDMTLKARVNALVGSRKRNKS